MSDGTPWRPLVRIEDMSRALLAVLEAPVEAIHTQAFNVGRTSENYAPQRTLRAGIEQTYQAAPRLTISRSWRDLYGTPPRRGPP